MTTVDPFATMINYYGASEECNRFKLGQTDISEYIQPNRWTLVKLHFDTSTTSGAYEAWIKPQGGEWIKVAEWIDGVTPDFSWTIPAEIVGGHNVLRIPTTVDTYDSWLYLDDFVIAASESDLPVYGDISDGSPAAPVLYNLAPIGTLDSTITSVILSLNTNEAATCAYGESPSQEFADMSVMSGAGGLAHQATVLVQSGSDYLYYVKCQDLEGNESDPSYIRFSVAEANQAPAPVISNGQPNWAVSYRETEVELSVETDIDATCRYAQNSGLAFADMQLFSSTNERAHSSTVPVTPGGSYHYYARCVGVDGGALSDEYHIHFDVEAEPFLLSNPLPSGILSSGITATQLAITTNREASCAYSQESAQAFEDMTPMSGAGLHHTADIAVAAGKEYRHYVKCMETQTGQLGESVISFSVEAAAPAVPVVFNGLPTWVVSYKATSQEISVETDIDASCRFSTTSGADFDDMTPFSNTDATFHSADVAVAAGKRYYHYVRCEAKDGGGGLSDEYSIVFEVESDPGK
jgi:hypothetical protein